MAEEKEKGAMMEMLKGFFMSPKGFIVIGLALFLFATEQGRKMIGISKKGSSTRSYRRRTTYRRPMRRMSRRRRR